jgi:hypothetical protein
MKTVKILSLTIVAMLIYTYTYAQAAADYLILQDIGDYRFKTQVKDILTGQTKNIPGYSMRIAPGHLAGAEHFDFDHEDKTYETSYVNRNVHLAVDVQVTKHAGADSDKWLLHEVEDGYRDPDVLDAKITEGAVLRIINGNRVFSWGAGTFTWLSSNNIVVRIEYIDLTGTKPEPLDVVQAYLQKFASSITLTDADAKSKAHSEQWIKDEMDRRLWLCDKWFYQLQLQKAEQKQVLTESVKSMKVFLDYREKYYGIKAADEKKLLSGYLAQNNGTGIKAKLAEYKNWWSVNKASAISLT